MRLELVLLVVLRHVSIHAPRFRGAMRWAASATSASSGGFQSTPPVSGERCASFAGAVRVHILFQSTPPVSGERCLFEVRGDFLRLMVSIHAPRFRGAMPYLVRPWPWAAQFQSTPPVSGERCLRDWGTGNLKPNVSIHAPRFRGAMRGPPRHGTHSPMFQSTPPVSGERCFRG